MFLYYGNIPKILLVTILNVVMANFYVKVCVKCSKLLFPFCLINYMFYGLVLITKVILR